ncbi:hypothetical protein GALMADRAFT_208996 [Galerina marginata CBS 339.88]|uniref:Uncharacterized protein n=1 Tax=Galerina marginata (strain CBS 339.88) TaxID=685588 RepID=A0A067T5X1_GALM3|nr:hypothetical protein GALMADRAFT_208996 [Galerina marginata CBS 339.88]
MATVVTSGAPRLPSDSRFYRGPVASSSSDTTLTGICELLREKVRKNTKDEHELVANYKVKKNVLKAKKVHSTFATIANSPIAIPDYSAFDLPNDDGVPDLAVGLGGLLFRFGTCFKRHSIINSPKKKEGAKNLTVKFDFPMRDKVTKKALRQQMLVNLKGPTLPLLEELHQWLKTWKSGRQIDGMRNNRKLLNRYHRIASCHCKQNEHLRKHDDMPYEQLNTPQRHQSQAREALRQRSVDVDERPRRRRTLATRPETPTPPLGAPEKATTQARQAARDIRDNDFEDSPRGAVPVKPRVKTNHSLSSSGESVMRHGLGSKLSVAAASVKGKNEQHNERRQSDQGGQDGNQTSRTCTPHSVAPSTPVSNAGRAVRGGGAMQIINHKHLLQPMKHLHSDQQLPTGFKEITSCQHMKAGQVVVLTIEILLLVHLSEEGQLREMCREIGLIFAS